MPLTKRHRPIHANVLAFYLKEMYKTIKEFYGSKAWKSVRDTYKRSKQGLCERCLAKGLIVPADEVHHKIRLTKENINEPSISLNYDNLEALCTECHDKEHEEDARNRWKKSARYKGNQRRYVIDARTGKALARE